MSAEGEAPPPSTASAARLAGWLTVLLAAPLALTDGPHVLWSEVLAAVVAGELARSFSSWAADDPKLADWLATGTAAVRVVVCWWVLGQVGLAEPLVRALLGLAVVQGASLAAVGASARMLVAR